MKFVFVIICMLIISFMVGLAWGYLLPNPWDILCALVSGVLIGFGGIAVIDTLEI